MEINKFNDETFFNFASKKIGADVRLFVHDMKFKKSDKGVKLAFYIGGESADGRRFVFTDDSCEYMNATFNNTIDVSREWITYLVEEVCETDEEANYFVDKYNAKLEAKIEKYAEAKRNLKINL